MSRHIASNSGLSRQSSSTKGCHLGGRAGARHIRPECPDHEPGDGLPIELGGANARIAEDEPQHVALLRRERTIVGQHRAAARFQATMSHVTVLTRAGLNSSASSTRCSRGVTPSDVW